VNDGILELEVIVVGRNTRDKLPSPSFHALRFLRHFTGCIVIEMSRPLTQKPMETNASQELVLNINYPLPRRRHAPACHIPQPSQSFPACVLPKSKWPSSSLKYKRWSLDRVIININKNILPGCSLWKSIEYLFFSVGRKCEAKEKGGKSFQSETIKWETPAV